ncbi:tRNA modification GTPase MnmE [Serratia fonticola]|uniref:tRNA modification GTPase MnmE n=1 Tax=Serratia fonticola TaxID=47917 RepID=A0A4U9TV94_SERFO|nr:tRNA modification GTPase MnmE [Serratia fonticola]
MPLHIIDTAGLREASDEVERIGIERAWNEIEQADRVLFMVDGTTTAATEPAEIWPEFYGTPAKYLADHRRAQQSRHYRRDIGPERK